MKKITLILAIIFISCQGNQNNNSNNSYNDSVAVLAVDTIPDNVVINKVDSVTIKKLRPLFNEKIDEFSSDKTRWITPKASPKYRNRNGIYCYFSENNLRFVFQYHSDDWLFINNCKFLIDDKNFEFTPDEVKRDNDDSGITEWFDVRVDFSNIEIIKALANAKKAKVKLDGDKYYKVVQISNSELNSIKNTFEYYKALGYSF